MGDKAMIDPKKTYRTRDGREVRIYAVDGLNGHRVHGAVLDQYGWEHRAWFANGRSNNCSESPIDLIEVRPRIQREVWVNVYPTDCTIHNDKDDADCFSKEGIRLACVKLVVDCEEGHGLD